MKNMNKISSVFIDLDLVFEIKSYLFSVLKGHLWDNDRENNSYKSIEEIVGETNIKDGIIRILQNESNGIDDQDPKVQQEKIMSKFYNHLPTIKPRLPTLSLLKHFSKEEVKTNYFTTCYESDMIDSLFNKWCTGIYFSTLQR